jgi:hypothetical protein
MTGTVPCVLSSYTADASAIPDMSATPIQIVKHIIGESTVNTLDF